MATQADHANPNSTLEARRQAAIAAAQRCSEILKQDFGADEVILFGSLRGDTPWHDQSDLDLAIRGLSSQDISKAYLRLEKVVPPWLAFDLVDIDTVPDHIRTQILQTAPMPENQYLALKTRIEGELVCWNKWQNPVVMSAHPCGRGHCYCSLMNIALFAM